EETLIGGVVIDAGTGLVDHGNQIGAVFGDGAEQLVRPVFRLFRTLALRDITIDDDQSLDLTLFIWNCGGDGFQNAPRPVFMAYAVFLPLAPSRKSCLFRRFQYPLAILGMDLLDGRRLL